jgi:hypothetical protein
MFLVPSVTYAISAQWDLDPVSGDWNTAANWTPMGVPNGPADTATFGLSNTTDVSISANTEVNSITFTSAATNPYVITVSSGLTLTLSGTGITNNSGITQSFVTGGQIHFTNSASAGNARIHCSGDLSSINFFNRSTAGSAVFSFSSDLSDFRSINFFNHSTAGSAVFSSDARNPVFGSINFFNRSTAGNAGIFADGPDVAFFDNSVQAVRASLLPISPVYYSPAAPVQVMRRSVAQVLLALATLPLREARRSAPPAASGSLTLPALPGVAQRRLSLARLLGYFRPRSEQIMT